MPTAHGRPDVSVRVKIMRMTSGAVFFRNVPTRKSVPHYVEFDKPDFAHYPYVLFLFVEQDIVESSFFRKTPNIHIPSFGVQSADPIVLSAVASCHKPYNS